MPGVGGQVVPPDNEVIGMTDSEDRREQARVAAEKMLTQLQDMIEAAGKTAGPILRDVAAKAAELTAVAAENAGPAAHKAADVTGQVGEKLAVRSRELAADLHKAAEAARVAQAEAGKGPEPKA